MSVLATADRGPVRILALNRPDARNALSTELREALRRALSDAEFAPGVRALVLTGEGPAFCAGLDLRELERAADVSPEDALADAQRLAALFRQVYAFPKPVVAAVRGAAVAGGAGLAAACDLVVAGEGARIGYTEARIGFVAALVAVLLVRQVGDRKARELLLTARLYSARDARTLGLVNEVVADRDVLDRSVALAAETARNAPAALAATKALLAALPGMHLDDALRHAAEVNARARATPDLREGVAAFFAGRDPSWRPHGLDPEPTDT